MASAAIAPTAAARRGSALALVLGNLVPAIGALFFDWGVLAVVLVYFAETAIVGGYAVLRIAFANGGGADKKFSVIPFFCFHYGLFVTVQTVLFVFFVGMFSKERLDSEVVSDVALAASGFVVSHGFSFVAHYWLHERHSADVKAEMQRPYGRILVQQLTVIVGAIGMMMLDLGKIGFILVLVAGKTALDLRGHLRSHSPTAA